MSDSNVLKVHGHIPGRGCYIWWRPENGEWHRKAIFVDSKGTLTIDPASFGMTPKEVFYTQVDYLNAWFGIPLNQLIHKGRKPKRQVR